MHVYCFCVGVRGDRSRGYCVDVWGREFTVWEKVCSVDFRGAGGGGGGGGGGGQSAYGSTCIQKLGGGGGGGCEGGGISYAITALYQPAVTLGPDANFWKYHN